MASPAANRLSQRHRRQLSALSATVAAGVINVAMGADPTDIDTWYLSAADGLLDRVLAGHSQARRMSTDYLRQHSVLSGHPVAPVPASLNTARARTSLRVTGPVAFKTAIGAGASEAQAVATMAERMSGAASRLALDGDRETFDATMRSGQGIIGYRRVLGGPGCGFCAMLASRGAVYLTEASASRTKDGLRYHDHCRCSPLPLYAHEAEPSEIRFMQRLWRDATRGHHGKDAQRAWRRSWEARQRAIRSAEPGGATRIPALDRPTALATDPALRMSLAELKAIVRAHAAQVKVSLSFFGTKKADIVARLRDWERTYTVKIAGLPVWKAPPAVRPGFEGVPPLAKPDPTGPPLTGAALNDWSDYFVHDQRSGRHEWVNAKGDTPPEGVRVDNLRVTLGAGVRGTVGSYPAYVVQTGTAWRFDGVSYLIEHGPNDFGAPWVSRALMELRDAHKAIPAAARANNSYALLTGTNPADSYWKIRYNNPGHVSVMTAGGGHINVWGFTPNASRVRDKVDSLRHETGHNLDDSIGRHVAGSESPDWLFAADKDLLVSSKIVNLQPTHHEAIDLAKFDPSRAYAKGVTRYGRSSPAEDWAESVMLYQLGPIATGRLPGVVIPKLPAMPSGFTAISDAEILYFRDIYPSRAAILDKLFPDIARAQKAEIAALRAPTKPVDLSKMTVTQLRAQAKAQGVKGYSRMLKADLITALGGKAPAKKAAKAAVKKAPAVKVPMPEFKGIPAADIARAKRIAMDSYRGEYVGRADAEWLRDFESRHGRGVMARLQMYMRVDLDYDDWRKWNGGKTKADLEREMKQVLSDAPIVIRRNRESTLVDILRRGRMRTQFETKRSGGLYDPRVRAEFEQAMWGYPGQGLDFDPTKRPVYGYFVPGGVDNEFAAGWASGYGSIRIVLKKQVRRRASFTVGDSLGRNAIASPVDKPDWRSYGFTHDRQGRPRNYSSSAFYGDVGYIEAQVHGGVTVDDIAEVVFSEQPKPATVAALRKAGVPWRIGKLRPAR